MKPDSPAQSDSPGLTLARLLAQARDRFRGGDLEGAKTLCAGLLDRGWAVREVYVLLADVYRAEGDRRKAEDTLKLAAEAPRAVLDAATGKVEAPPVGRRIWVAPPLPLYWPVLIGGGCLAVAAAVAAYWLPTTLPWFGLNLTHVLLLFAAGLLGFGSLAASGLIRTFDQELTELGPGEDLPLWVYLLATGVLSAGLALALFLWNAYTRGEFTRTTLAVLVTFLLLGTVGGLAVGGGLAFWWLGLNALWEGGLLGWAVGSVTSPREWWQT